MKIKHIVILALALLAFAKSDRDVVRNASPETTVIVESGVIMGNPPPSSGVLCENANVYGGPYSTFEPQYSLPVGTVVDIREIAQEYNSKKWWAMIDSRPPLWIQMSALCKR